jgi:hypothetical protein
MADAISSYQACKDEATHIKLNVPSSYALPCYFGDETARVKLNVLPEMGSSEDRSLTKAGPP